eukprot:scaffold243394_cov42-Prasinocladus_malaysianus.AAC.1
MANPNVPSIFLISRSRQIFGMAELISLAEATCAETSASHAACSQALTSLAKRLPDGASGLTSTEMEGVQRPRARLHAQLSSLLFLHFSSDSTSRHLSMRATYWENATSAAGTEAQLPMESLSSSSNMDQLRRVQAPGSLENEVWAVHMHAPCKAASQSAALSWLWHSTAATTSRSSTPRDGPSCLVDM